MCAVSGPGAGGTSYKETVRRPEDLTQTHTVTEIQVINFIKQQMYRECRVIQYVSEPAKPSTLLFL